VFTDAGKPIYSRHGDDNALGPFLATLSAIIPKIESYFAQTGNTLRFVYSEKFMVALMKRGSLIYVAFH
jgi:hypothetical protein